MKECLHCCSAVSKKSHSERETGPLVNKAEPGIERLHLENLLTSGAIETCDTGRGTRSCVSCSLSQPVSSLL